MKTNGMSTNQAIGTTAHPKVSFYSHSELESVSRQLAEGLTRCGVRAGDLVANLFYAGDLYGSFLLHILSVYHLPPGGAIQLPIAGHLSLESMEAHIVEFEASGVLATVTTMSKLAERILSAGKTHPYVRLLLFSGEAFYADQAGQDGKPPTRYVREYVDTHLLSHALAWETTNKAPRPVREQFARPGLAFPDVPLPYRPHELRTVAGIPHAELDALPVFHAGTEAEAALAARAVRLGHQLLPRHHRGHGGVRRERYPHGGGQDAGWCDVRRQRAEEVGDGGAVGDRRHSGSSSSGIFLLVIHLDAPGASIRKIHKTGHNAGPSSRVELRDVKVSAKNRLGPEGGGLGLVLRNFNKERRSENPLAPRQLIRLKLVSLARDIEAHWTWLEQIAHHGKMSAEGWQTKDIAGPVALAKVQGAQVVERAVREAQQILGGRDYERGRTMTELVSRDLRLKVIGGGSEAILSDLAWREEHKIAKVKQDQRQQQGAKRKFRMPLGSCGVSLDELFIGMRRNQE
ncbi:uncharacterized protein PG986_001481 [Apiospora aurea]|uniref:Acyl-CoA dehydrogenase/oxidase C-terminal domain-containing protein n=1 Tax=Apiospora aurea TaxID=335848 RepID=A0ABR1QX41_9PEZI